MIAAAARRIALAVLVLTTVAASLGCSGSGVRQDDADRPDRPPIRRTPDEDDARKRPAAVLRDANRTVGRELYALKCQSCHGTVAVPGSAGRSLFELDWSDERRVAAAQAVIVEGLGEMPAFGNRMPEQQIRDIMLWIATARAPARPPRDSRRPR